MLLKRSTPSPVVLGSLDCLARWTPRNTTRKRGWPTSQWVVWHFYLTRAGPREALTFGLVLLRDHHLFHVLLRWFPELRRPRSAQDRRYASRHRRMDGERFPPALRERLPTRILATRVLALVFLNGGHPNLWTNASTTTRADERFVCARCLSSWRSPSVS